MRHKWALLLLIPVVGCDNVVTDQAFRESVAQKFLDADNPPAPTPKLADELRRLNECSADRIRSSDIAYGDSQDEITAKVHAAMARCTREVYGGDEGQTEPSPTQ